MAGVPSRVVKGIFVCVLLIPLIKMWIDFNSAQVIDGDAEILDAVLTVDKKFHGFALEHLASWFSRKRRTELNSVAFKILFGIDASSSMGMVSSPNFARVRLIAGRVAAIQQSFSSPTLASALLPLRMHEGIVFQPLSGPDILAMLLLFNKVGEIHFQVIM